jgi:hypothetical protein
MADESGAQAAQLNDENDNSILLLYTHETVAKERDPAVT